MRIEFKLIIFLFFILRTFLFAQDSLVLGEFKLDKIIDGDSFKFKGLDRNARLLGLDTEETHKSGDVKSKADSIKKNWGEVYRSERLKEPRPVKIESPFGYKTLQWANELFKDVLKVRLEKESDSRFIDIYNRYLLYVIAIRKDGTEFNYNIECVKQGFSPYHTKYGYSKRFHKEFTDAQEYARENKLGIWSGTEFCYPDYEERLEWWNRRAEAIKNFEVKYKNQSGYFEISDEKDFLNLRGYIGMEVIIFGSISDVFLNKEPYLIRFSHSNNEHLDVTIYSENYYLFDEMNIKNLEGGYVYVKGGLKDYEGKYEINLTNKNQMWSE